MSDGINYDQLPERLKGDPLFLPTDFVSERVFSDDELLDFFCETFEFLKEDTMLVEDVDALNLKTDVPQDGKPRLLCGRLDVGGDFPWYLTVERHPPDREWEAKMKEKLGATLGLAKLFSKKFGCRCILHEEGFSDARYILVNGYIIKSILLDDDYRMETGQFRIWKELR